MTTKMAMRLILLTVFVAMPWAAFACIPAYVPHSSQEPVTIKVGDLLFQIPAHLISNPFERLSAEHPKIQIGPTVNEVVPASMLSGYIMDPRHQERFGILIFEELPPGLRPGTIVALSDRVRIEFTEYMYFRGQKFVFPPDIVESFVRAMIVPYAPAGWEKDVALAAMLKLPESPCEGFGSPHRERKAAPEPSYDDLLSGIVNSNERIRHAAAIKLGQADAVHKAEVMEILQGVISDDASEYVRIGAITGLTEIAKQDNLLTPLLIHSMVADPSERVRQLAAGRLQNTFRKSPSASLEPVIAEIEQADQASLYHIASLLAGVIFDECKANGAHKPRQLSARANRALDGISIILRHPAGDRGASRALGLLEKSKPAFARDDFVDLLTRIKDEGRGDRSAAARGLLKQL